MPRILLVNSNTTASITERIATAARAGAAPGTEVLAVTAPFGLPLIVTPADWLLAGPPTLAALAEHGAGCDAAVIACFGDPGLEAAKQLFPFPVLGISEAAFHLACLLGRRFGIVSFTAALRPMFQDCLERHSLAARCVGFRMGPPFAGDPGRVAEERRGLLLDLVWQSVKEDGAEVVILAGAPLAGLAATLQAELPVPLVDGVVAGVRLAAALVGLTPERRKPESPLSGYPASLSALYGGG
ncbi:MAG: aspartate/glutamate racemase family protein [Rhodovarius sp.]|nr:aspartate/glutamate racemase family protein [Rhodovarius sp.]